MSTPDPVRSRLLGGKHRTGVDWFLLGLRVAVATLLAVGLLGFVAQQIDNDNLFARWANPGATGLTAQQIQGLVVSGLSQGAMYGLIALGYSMVYGVLGFINFAHGEVFMVGAMTGMITANKLADAGAWESNFLASLVFIVIVSIAVCTLTAMLLERVAYRPLRNSPRLIPLITSIGVSFLLQNVAVVLLGPGTKSYPDVPDWLKNKVAVLDIEGAKILVIIVAAVSMVGLWYYVDRTKNRQGDESRCRGRRDSGVDGHRREPHHREGVRSGWRHGRGGRNPVGDPVPQRDPHHRIPAGDQGFQRCCGGRNRQPRRGHGRRAHHRTGRITGAADDPGTARGCAAFRSCVTRWRSRC